MRLPPCLLLSAAWLIHHAAAVFTDEAYESDYHHALIGLPQQHTTFFHRPSIDSKGSLLYTLSDRGVLGAVNPRDGHIIWRQPLSARYNATEAYLVAAERSDVVVSAVEGQVAAWSARNGKLVWSSTLPHNAVVRGLASLGGPATADGSVGRSVMLVREQDGVVVQALGEVDGETRWQYSEPSEKPIAIGTTQNSVHVLSSYGSSTGTLKLRVTILDPNTGSKTDSYNLSLDSDITSASQLSFAYTQSGVALIAWPDKLHKTLKLNVLGNSNVQSMVIDGTSEGKIEAVRVHAGTIAGQLSHFLVHYQTAATHWADVFVVNTKTKKVSPSYALPKTDGNGAFTCSKIGEEIAFVHTTANEVVLLTSETGSVTALWPLTPQQKNELHAPIQVVAEVGASTGQSRPIRAAVLSSLGEWTMFRNGNTDWTRTEYLTQALDAVFVEVAHKKALARELEHEGKQSSIGAFIHRLTRHLNDVSSLVTYLQNTFTNVVGTTSSGAGSGFGVNKIVVLALERGYLVALKPQSGNVLWNTKASSAVPWSNADPPELRARPNGVVEVWTRGRAKPFTVNASNGQVSTAPEGVHSERDPVGENPSALDLTFSVVRNGLRGYRADRPATPLWQFSVADKLRIVDVAIRPTVDPTASIGTVLGDRKVLYKYLNRNLAIVLAVEDASNTLKIFLVDTVSGMCLYTASHGGVDTSKNVVSTISENSFAYSYSIDGDVLSSTAESHGPQLVIAELYESPFPNDRGALGSAGNYSSRGAQITSQLLPFVISQTYNIPEAITGLTITQTQQGITSHALLATLVDSGGIIAIPRQILDPRRPVGRDATSDEAAEGLMRYAPSLDFDPKWFLNHKRELFGIKKVITSASMLESTSLVFAFGLDVFGTRVSPSFTFDILGKAFNKVQMLLTVAALAVAVVAVKPLVSKKQTDAQWQLS